MEVNKTCLDCKFAVWQKGEKDIQKDFGACMWLFPINLPVWLKVFNLLAIPEIQRLRPIEKKQPYLDCNAWEEKNENSSAQN